MNKSQLNWYVGKIVYDHAFGKSGLVIRTPANWIDTDGQDHTWDFDILYEDGDFGQADVEELEVRSAKTLAEAVNAEAQKG